MLNFLPDTYQILGLSKIADQMFALADSAFQNDPKGALVLKGLGAELSDLDRTLYDIDEVLFTALDVSDNRLEELPGIIEKLRGLETFIATNNQLNTLPWQLGSFTDLKELYLDKNQLKVLPKSLKSLQDLQILNLSDNKFQVFPQEIVRLRGLIELKLSGNAIDVLPENLKDCTTLELLDLSNNYLTELPEGLLEALPNLTELNLENNPLSEAAKAALRPFQDKVTIKVGFVVPSYGDPVANDPGSDEAIDLKAMTISECKLSDDELYTTLIRAQHALSKPLLGGDLKPIGRPRLL